MIAVVDELNRHGRPVRRDRSAERREAKPRPATSITVHLDAEEVAAFKERVLLEEGQQLAWGDRGHDRAPAEVLRRLIRDYIRGGRR